MKTKFDTQRSHLAQLAPQSATILIKCSQLFFYKQKNFRIICAFTCHIVTISLSMALFHI